MLKDLMDKLLYAEFYGENKHSLTKIINLPKWLSEQEKREIFDETVEKFPQVKVELQDNKLIVKLKEPVRE